MFMSETKRTCPVPGKMLYSTGTVMVNAHVRDRWIITWPYFKNMIWIIVYIIIIIIKMRKGHI